MIAFPFGATPTAVPGPIPRHCFCNYDTIALALTRFTVDESLFLLSKVMTGQERTLWKSVQAAFLE